MTPESLSARWHSANNQTTIDLYCGHALDVLAELPERSVQCVVTSPPYWGLRDYGIAPQVWGGEAACAHEWGESIVLDKSTPGVTGSGLTNAGASQASSNRFVAISAFCRCGAWRGSLGLEPTPALYVAHMVEVFRAVRRVLRDDGTLWLNLGDSYNAYNNNRGRAKGANKNHHEIMPVAAGGLSSRRTRSTARNTSTMWATYSAGVGSRPSDPRHAPHRQNAEIATNRFEDA